MVYGNTKIGKVGLCRWHVVKYEMTEAEAEDGMPEIIHGQTFPHGNLLVTATQ